MFSFKRLILPPNLPPLGLHRPQMPYHSSCFATDTMPMSDPLSVRYGHCYTNLVVTRNIHSVGTHTACHCEQIQRGYRTLRGCASAPRQLSSYPATFIDCSHLHESKHAGRHHTKYRCYYPPCNFRYAEFTRCKEMRWHVE
jgi:hypothetical protein